MTVRFDYPPGATPRDADELASLIPGHIRTQGELNECEQLNIAWSPFTPFRTAMVVMPGSWPTCSSNAWDALATSGAGGN